MPDLDDEPTTHTFVRELLATFVESRRNIRMSSREIILELDYFGGFLKGLRLMLELEQRTLLFCIDSLS